MDKNIYMILKGEKIKLRPTKIDEISLFYKFATGSDATPFWYGELYGNKIPTYDEFLSDWKSYYFDGSAPESGRSFMITNDEKIIGQINYNKIDKTNNSVELDIIIFDDSDKGKGYGSDALKVLEQYLFKKMNVEECFLDVIESNQRAIMAYEKAGFKIRRQFQKNGKDWNRMVIKRTLKTKEVKTEKK